MSFIRRYAFDPGTAELSKIEGIVIIDRDPPAALAGTGTGMVTVVGEFEDGAFNSPYEVTSNTDFTNNFGGFGFVYDGVESNNPCARSRKADAALLPEYWNGNGFLACVNKKFRRLAVVRVDTSVGAVEFTRRASILGSSNFQYDLEPAQHLDIDIGAGPVVATFNAAVAAKTSGSGTYPTGFVGGEKMTIVVDENTPQQIGPLTVTFLSGDTTQAAVISRINLTFGFVLAITTSATVFHMDGRVRGTSGNVRVVSQDASVATALAFNTTVQNGTGNVANIDQVTFAEVQTIVQAAVAGTTVDKTPSGKLRISANAAASITPLAATTALDLGFTLGVASTAAAGVDGFIPAGTRVRTAGGVEWVTCQTIAVKAATAGPYSTKIRPALDDGTIAGTGAGTVVVMPFGVELAGFSVINPQPITAALTEAAIDAAYSKAFASTLSQNAVTKETNLLVCARSSNANRQAGRANSITASDQGLRGRRFMMRPPLNTKRVDAKSLLAQPGVGAYRSDRVVYCYPGVNTFVPQIAARGLSGGAGFTADGIVDLGFDSFVASCISQLNPEENPGQLTAFMGAVLGVERNNADVQDLTMDDYTAFKAVGIAALMMEEGTATIQSGVVNVDPAQYANIKNIARRGMADYIQDSLAIALKPFVKKLASAQRRGECAGVVKGFLEGLMSPGNKASQRIAFYTLDAKSGNTAPALALGIFRIIIKVQTLPSLDVIVLETTIGETVTFNDVALAA